MFLLLFWLNDIKVKGVFLRLSFFIKLLVTLVPLCFFNNAAHAQACYQTSVLSPSPFLGNHGEIVKLGDGSTWKVMGSYEYMYAYYPSVNICPSSGKLLVEGKTISVIPVGSASGNASKQLPSSQIKVVFKRSGCRGYFLADGDSAGVYLLEWYGGYDPSEGDVIVGNIRGYGFKDVFYPQRSASGRVYVDDFLLSSSRAIEKIREKCN